jgi:hypothetical protein
VCFYLLSYLVLLNALKISLSSIGIKPSIIAIINSTVVKALIENKAATGGM